MRRVGDALEAQPLAQDVLDRLGPRRALADARQPQLLHRPRRVLRARRRLGRDRLVGRRLERRRILDLAVVVRFDCRVTAIGRYSVLTA